MVHNLYILFRSSFPLRYARYPSIIDFMTNSTRSKKLTNKFVIFVHCDTSINPRFVLAVLKKDKDLYKLEICRFYLLIPIFLANLSPASTSFSSNGYMLFSFARSFCPKRTVKTIIAKRYAIANSHTLPFNNLCSFAK